MLVPTCPLAHPALRTGVAVGAGQAVSSHLRRWLVTAVQELLGAEHVAGVGHPVHAVQDADLGRGRAQWAHSLLPSPLPALGGPSLHPCPLTTPYPPQLPLLYPQLGSRSPLPGLQFPSPTTRGLSPLPHPGSSPGEGTGRGEVGCGWKGGSSGYLHDEFIAGVTPIHF